MNKRKRAQYLHDFEEIRAAIELLIENNPTSVFTTSELVDWCHELEIWGSDRTTVRKVALAMVEDYQLNIAVRAGYHNHLFTSFDALTWRQPPELG